MLRRSKLGFFSIEMEEVKLKLPIFIFNGTAGGNRPSQTSHVSIDSRVIGVSSFLATLMEDWHHSAFINIMFGQCSSIPRSVMLALRFPEMEIQLPGFWKFREWWISQFCIVFYFFFEVVFSSALKEKWRWNHDEAAPFLRWLPQRVAAIAGVEVGGTWMKPRRVKTWQNSTSVSIYHSTSTNDFMYTYDICLFVH